MAVAKETSEKKIGLKNRIANLTDTNLLLTITIVVFFVM